MPRPAHLPQSAITPRPGHTVEWMWALKVVLACVCWAGATAQPHQHFKDELHRPRRSTGGHAALREVADSQRDIINILEGTKSVLDTLRQEFTAYRTDDNAKKEALRHLSDLADRREERIDNLTAVVNEKTSVIRERDATIQALEEEKAAMVEAHQHQRLELDAVKEDLSTLRRQTQWDCAQLLLQGHNTSGAYNIYPRNSHEVARVWCDMETDGGGWTVFLRRQTQTPQLDFNQPWAMYADGFGDPAGEYWLGNKHIHAITKDRPYVLRIDAHNLEGEQRFGVWRVFTIGDENSKFKIRVSGYSTDSTLGDVLTEVDQNGEKYNPNGMKFSTMDQDNDRREGKSCSRSFGSGGWWYNNCYRLNPTAPLGTRHDDNTKARLYYWGPDMYTVQGIKAIQLKIRLA